ncbi:MAG TPA: NAD-dependent epimerase [Methylophilaceae bacterium]|nr:NAD-dependent epimerase [Methylophilaceae bacterium]
MKILVTGAAGFIGYHVTERLLDAGNQVVGVDNLNDYYEVSLKQARLDALNSHAQYSNFSFTKMDMADLGKCEALFHEHMFDCVVHLAAQAGVRYSITNPHTYIQSNLVAFANILEACRHNAIGHLVYASSSSVYGGNTKLPFSENDPVDHPVSLYAATKKSNELMAYTYSHLYGFPSTGLRFFTVYGPWGRPDMAPFLFADAILKGKPINVFNHGEMLRDFTYIDDIVEAILRVIVKPPSKTPVENAAESSEVPYQIFNIGNNKPEKLMDFITLLEKSLGKSTEKIFLPMQAGDVKATFADTSKLDAWIGFKPDTSLEQGIEKFVHWYKQYYQL